MLAEPAEEISIMVGFQGSSRVTLADGTVKLMCDIAVGDEVMTYDSSTQKLVKAKVTKITSQETDRIYTVGDIICGRSTKLFNPDKSKLDIHSSDLFQQVYLYRGREHDCVLTLIRGRLVKLPYVISYFNGIKREIISLDLENNYNTIIVNDILVKANS